MTGSTLNRRLTDRQRQVLALIAAGYRNQQIADQLNISLDTVKSHVENILAKLGAENRGHAVVLAMQAGGL